MKGRPRRFWALVGTGLLVVTAITVALGVNTLAGAHPDPCASRVKDSARHQRLVTGSGRHVVVIGDSYSLGSGLRKGEAAWPVQLPGQVQVFGYGGSGFSRGAGGCPASSFAERAVKALATHPDLVVIEGGLNDYDQPSADIRAGYRALIAEVGTTPALVVGPPPAPNRPAQATRVDEVLRSETTRSGTPYLSMITQQLDYLPDQLHLTEDGHRNFGGIVATALNR